MRIGKAAHGHRERLPAGVSSPHAATPDQETPKSRFVRRTRLAKRRPAPAKAHASPARRTRARSARNGAGRRPENGGQNPSPRKKEIPEFRENGGQTNGGQTRLARKKEIPEFPENGGQSNGGQTRRARKKEIPEFPQNGGQTNGGQASQPWRVALPIGPSVVATYGLSGMHPEWHEGGVCRLEFVSNGQGATY
jgi:hypothetical protein